MRFLRGAFDSEFYLSAYPDVAAGGMDPVTHYVHHGERDGRLPSRDFDPKYYRASNPDLKHAPFNLYWHFLFAGRREGRSGMAPLTDKFSSSDDLERLVLILRPYIDLDYYAQSNKDVTESGFELVRHYIRHGEGEGRQPCAEFNPVAYRSLHPELADAGVSLYWHYLYHRQDEKKIYITPQLVDLAIKDAQEVAPHFDEEFYLEQCPEAARSNVSPLMHYLAVGEREGLRPTRYFDPNYYLRANPDLSGLKRSVFWHYVTAGRAELRSPARYYEINEKPAFTVTAIIPNYNHAHFLKERVRSVVNQTYEHIEVIILDDCSSDESRDIIKLLAQQCSRPVQVCFNDSNSGNVSAQWKRGIEMASGDLIWICESDDFCELDFLEHIVAHFADLSVTMAFGNIQFCDAEGGPMPGMDSFRALCEPTLDWSVNIKRPAFEWFCNVLGVQNVMANVSGCLFRRQNLPDAVWQEALTYRIMGDWFLYSRIAGGGQIVYEPRSTAFFRQHGKNTSSSNFHKEHYYREHAQLMNALCRMWDIPRATRLAFVSRVRHEFDHFKGAEHGLDFESLVPTAELLAAERTTQHIQLGFLGFHSGGGEVFAMGLAALLVERGHTVSMVAQNLTKMQEDMRRSLSPRLAVYDIADVNVEGRSAYLARRGVDLFHSHVNGIDTYFFARSEVSAPTVPYVITMHGSHNVLNLSEPSIRAFVERLAREVAAFVYTADKNLEVFTGVNRPQDRLSKIANALPHDERRFEGGRAALGIAPDAIIFTFVARGVERKGWRVAINAFCALRRAHPTLPMHLLMVGDGEKAEEASALVTPDNSSAITFLGYQPRVSGIYALSDCAILPTRFPGESSPLCLIQAAQEGVPIIASDTGEIPNLLDLEGERGGRIVPVQRDTAAFTTAFAKEMERLLDPHERARYGAYARRIAQKYSTDVMVDKYEEIYEFASLRSQTAAE